MRRAAPAFALALLALGFAWACVQFARQPTLASIADDSVSYLVLAQAFSPWQAASPAVAEAAAREASYPPLFPALLALAGAAHDVARAYTVVALLLAACLPLVYLLGKVWLGSRAAALGAAAAMALLPATWIMSKGILSEPLYSVLLLAALWILEWPLERRGRTAALALLMSALVMTRTAGVALVAAFALWALTRRGASFAERLKLATPSAVAAAPIPAWLLLRAGEAHDPNLPVLQDLWQSLLAGRFPWSEYGASMLRQLQAFTDAWTGALLLYWLEGQPPRVLLAEALGVLALAGLALRLRSGRPDAWMASAYLVTYLLWPFYDQMPRFLYPLFPVLVLYAFLAAGAAMRAFGRPEALAHAIVGLLVVSLTIPPLAFIRQRASADSRHAEMIDWYRRADIEDARARAEVHLDLLADMEAIRVLTGPQASVMWVTPSYIALLADRRGVHAPPERFTPERYREAVREAAPDYVFLSLYHPRDTVRDTAWRVGIAALLQNGEVVQARRNTAGVLTSVLLRPRPGAAGGRRS